MECGGHGARPASLRPGEGQQLEGALLLGVGRHGLLYPVDATRRAQGRGEDWAAGDVLVWMSSGVLLGELTQGEGPEQQPEVTQGDVPEPADDDQGDDDHSQPGSDHVGEDLGP